MRAVCYALALIGMMVAAVDGATGQHRLLVLPGPSSKASVTSMWKLSLELSARGFDVLFATAQHDEGLLGEVPPGGPSVALYKPFEGSSPLTLPVWLNAKAQTKKDAIKALEQKPKSDMEVWVDRLRRWYAANCEAVMGADEQLLATMKAFKPTHVIGDSAFVCFSHVADLLGGLPRIAVAVSLMPPLEKSMYGMTESFFEIPVYRSGLPRHMTTTHLLAQAKAHMSIMGSVKRTFRHLDDLARAKYNISTGKGPKDPESGLLQRLSGVQALVVGLDPMLSAIPVQQPPHVHVVGPLAQPESPLSSSSAASRQAVLLHVASWSAGPSALNALMTAVSGLQATGTQFKLLNGLPPQALLERLGAEQQAALQSLASTDAGQLQTAAALVCEASQAITYEAAFAGVPLVAVPSSGDQLDQATRAEEAGVAVVLRQPSKESKASNPQTDVSALGAAIQQVTAPANRYLEAAQVLAEALQARRRHPVQAAADVIELTVQRHAASVQLAKLTGVAADQVLQKPGHADGSNLLMTTAFAAGFLFMILSTLASHTIKKKAAETEAAEKAAQAQAAGSEVAAGSGSKAHKKRN